MNTSVLPTPRRRAFSAVHRPTPGSRSRLSTADSIGPEARRFPRRISSPAAAASAASERLFAPLSPIERKADGSSEPSSFGVGTLGTSTPSTSRNAPVRSRSRSFIVFAARTESCWPRMEWISAS